LLRELALRHNFEVDRMVLTRHNATAAATTTARRLSFGGATPAPPASERRRSPAAAANPTHERDAERERCMQLLLGNCRCLIDNSPRALAYEVLRTLTTDLSPSFCESELGVSRVRLLRARRTLHSRVAQPLASVRSRHAPRRVKAPTARETAQAFWRSLCRQSRQLDPDTGERRDLFYLGIRQEEAWVRYVAYCVATMADDDADDGDGAKEFELPEVTFGDITSFNFPTAFYSKHKQNLLKRTTFFEARPSNVRKETLVEASCPICRDGMRAEDRLQRASSENLQLDDDDQREQNAAVEKMNVHKVVVRHQRQQQQAHRDNVGTKGYPDLLINFDFSPFAKVYDARRSLSDAMGDTQDLIVTIYYRDPVDSKVKSLNVDHFAQESNDHTFFRRVMLNVFNLDLVRKGPPGLHNTAVRPTWIEMWSDGGPKHFKIRRSIFFVCVELLKRMRRLRRLTWAFYASHHGKSVNDAHAAVVKRLLWRLARGGQRTEGPRQLADVAKNVKNSTAFFFDKFDREEQFDVSTMPGIKTHHFFEWRDRKMNGDKFVITMGKVYPTLAGGQLHVDDDNCKQVDVEALYSINFDDVAGEALDVTAEGRKEQKATAANERKQRKLQERVDAALANLRKNGTRVQVRYDVDGRTYGQWWTGTVVDHRAAASGGAADGDSTAVEQIKVRYDLDKLAKKRGETKEVEEWVDLDTGVRLCATSS
jgi:hypothetical protein